LRFSLSDRAAILRVVSCTLVLISCLFFTASTANAHGHHRHGPLFRHGVSHSHHIARHGHHWRHHRPRHLARAAHPRAGGNVLAEAKRWLGRSNMTGSRGAWCADFTQWVLKRTGHSIVHSRLARDAVRAGRPLAAPVPGAIMSLPHHTGFVVSVLGHGRVLLVSGNYGHRVGLGVYSTRHARFAEPETSG
jgi:hypothetical protein